MSMELSFMILTYVEMKYLIRIIGNYLRMRII